MELTRVEIRNYRSIFEHTSTQHGLTLDLAEGLNVLVGRNNCGKSNLFRALAAALDPAYDFVPSRDLPGPLPHRYPVVQLTFRCDPNDPEEAKLLDLAGEYERAATGGEMTRAVGNEIVFSVAYAPTEDGRFERRERIVFLDGSEEPTAGHGVGAEPLLAPVIDALRALVRFVMVSSGESIESVLEGNFREILHSVVKDRLRDEFAAAEDHRQEYIKGLQAELLGPLREIVGESVGRLFPEISDISFAPDVSDIESTLANVEIGLHDAVNTPMAQKGTGVRGGVLVAMLRYLAANTNRCVIMAVEEPEAFLHPAAQEDLREDLEALAVRNDVTVLVTTHSPFIVSRNADARSVLLDKDGDGRTRIAAVSSGDDARVSVLSGIVREEGFEDVLKASQAIAPDAAAVLLVEGYGDKQYIEMAARKLGRPGLIADLQIIPSNGCSRMVHLASLVASSTSVPIGILFDNDEPGRQGADRLARLESHETRTNIFNKKRHIHSYRDVFNSDFPWEAEDLFPWELVQEFVDSVGGPYIAKGLSQRPDGGYHFDLGEEHKTALGAFLEERLTADDLELWERLLVGIRTKLDLPEEAEKAIGNAETGHRAAPVSNPADQQQHADPAAPDPEPAETEQPDERVLVVAQNYGHAEYIRSNVYTGEPGRGLSPDIRYIAFYESGEIRTDVPKVLARHDDLVFSDELAQRLTNGSTEDQALAKFMAEELETGRRAPGETRQVFLLSSPESEETIKLDAPIANTTRSPKGRPMAWVVRHRLTWLRALNGGATTDEIDRYDKTKEADRR